MSTPKLLLQIDSSARDSPREEALSFFLRPFFSTATPGQLARLSGRRHVSRMRGAVLLLAPDLCMLGYLAGVRLGAAYYCKSGKDGDVKPPLQQVGQRWRRKAASTTGRAKMAT